MRQDSRAAGTSRLSVLRPGRRAASLILAWCLISAAGAVELVNLQKQGRAEIEARYRLRAETVSRFVETYVGDFFEQERRAASRVLGGDLTTRGAFNRTVTLIGARAAVLLDADGTVVETAPLDPELRGVDLSGGDQYIRSAIAGVPAVSNVVRSAVDGRPVIDFAVPIEVAGKPHVLSGSFGVGSTPLAGYVRRAAVLAPNRIYLADANGVVFASNDADQSNGRSLPGELAAFSGESGSGPIAAHSEAGDYLVARSVPGTPWRLMIVASTSTLYAGTGGIGRLVPWILWLGFVAGGLLSIVLFERLSRRRRHLIGLNEQLGRLARIDVLTGLPNRRAAEEELERALATSNRYADPLSLLMVDIDCFKEVNDQYGHATGDAALRHVADRIAETLRVTDLAGRWAGDEFLLVLPHMSEEGASALASRLNDHVRNSPLSRADAELVLELSIGVAEWTGEGMSELIDRADRALYAAKRAGRNRFAVAPDEATPFPRSGPIRQI